MAQRISFDVAGSRVVADLHRGSGAGPRPAVVVVGPMTSVKEQVTGRYARELAARGWTALAIDHRGFGESGGVPAQVEDPASKIEDVRVALDVLGADSAVDESKLGLVGVCLGASYAAAASVGRDDVRALATVVGYFPNPHQMREGDPGAWDAEVATGARARERWEREGVLDLVPAAGPPGSGAPMTGPDIVDYYTRRAAVATYRNEFAVMSRDSWLPFDAQAAARHVSAPTLFLHAEGALSPRWAQQFCDAMRALRTFTWLEPGVQSDFYDQPDRIETAVDHVCDHLARHLT